jgi:hypothetical protein
MRSFPDDVKSAFRSFAIALHHLVFQRFIAKYGGVGGIPALAIENLQLIMAFYDQDIDLSFRIGMEEAFMGGPVMCIFKRKKAEYEQASQEDLLQRHLRQFYLWTTGRGLGLFPMWKILTYDQVVRDKEEGRPKQKPAPGMAPVTTTHENS